MSTLTTIQANDLITNSRTVINDNFTALNNEKIETSALDDDSTLSANSATKIASQRATKLYVDTGGNVNASETNKGIVEEATDSEVTAGTATGGTGAKLVVTPAKLATRLTVVLSSVQSFASSGTWTKPASGKMALVECWGGGGSGAKDSVRNSGGGGGGAYNFAFIPLTTLGDTETVTIGDGGVSITSNGVGNVGGNTTFGSWVTAYGGGGGGYSTTDQSGGGGGGGSSGTGNQGSTGVTAGGGAGGGILGGVAGTTGNGGDSVFGGGGGSYSGGGGSSVYGGGGSSSTGGNSTYGGGGGAGAGGTAGASKFGGAGGASGATGTAGSVPSGGGGASTSGNSGVGGKGQCRVTVY